MKRLIEIQTWQMYEIEVPDDETLGNTIHEMCQAHPEWLAVLARHPLKFRADLSAFDISAYQICRQCGCTDEDCSLCTVAQDGLPCHWVEEDLCSRCQKELKATGNAK